MTVRESVDNLQLRLGVAVRTTHATAVQQGRKRMSWGVCVRLRRDRNDAHCSLK